MRLKPYRRCLGCQPTRAGRPVAQGKVLLERALCGDRMAGEVNIAGAWVTRDAAGQVLVTADRVRRLLQPDPRGQQPEQMIEKTFARPVSVLSEPFPRPSDGGVVLAALVKFSDRPVRPAEANRQEGAGLRFMRLSREHAEAADAGEQVPDRRGRERQHFRQAE